MIGKMGSHNGLIFSLHDEPYTKADLWWILYKVFIHAKRIRTNKRVTYYNVPCAFDIETSSFYINDEKQACMYIWMLGIGGYCIIGRTWDDFIETMDYITNYLALNEDIRIVVYVHNLAYEIQFIRKLFSWKKCFSLEERKPLNWVTNSGIEFRCSYLLSGYSLAALSSQLTKYDVKKQVGNLDYDKIRHSQTPLTKDELKYCIYDVLVVMAYIQERMDTDGDITLIPMTKTGYVRQYCRRACIGTSKHRNNKYRNMIKGLTIEPDEYRMLRRAFQGGFTHANAFYSGKVLHDVDSYDFTSSYPTVMVAEKFPMSKGKRVNINSVDEFNKYIHKYACVFDVRFTNIQCKAIFEDYISSSRCSVLDEPVLNNGRVVSADLLQTTITELDYMIIKSMYKWDTMSIGTMYIYKKAYLPTEFVQSILKLYADKTQLKGVPDREVDYLKGKEMLNSCYGMTVTDICRDEIIYNNDEWSKTKSDIAKSLDKYNNATSRFLFYPWGVWVTAYARARLFTGILECRNDYVYSDTDSLKILNRNKHVAYIDRYNKSIVNQLYKSMDYHGLPHNLIEPKTIQGKPKPLGVWDYEGNYTTFKTLGAKRYLVEHDGKLILTVAGLNKRVARDYIASQESPFDYFSEGMTIPADYTGKMTHTYIDDEISGTVVDCYGNTGTYHEMSCVHMEDAPYELSLSQTYIDYIMKVREEGVIC